MNKMEPSETTFPVKEAQCCLEGLDWNRVVEQECRYIDYLSLIDYKPMATWDVDDDIARLLDTFQTARTQRDLTYRADLIVCASDSPSCNQTEVDFQWKVLKCRQGRVDMDIGDIDWNRYDFMGIATTFPNKKPQYCYSLRKLGETEF